MRRLRSLRGLARRLWRRGEFEQGLSEELQFHLEARADHLERTGLSRAEAVRRARLELGGLEGYKEECRQASGLWLFDDLVGDVRYAARGLRRDPGFTLIAVLVLALALGANTALFTFLNAYFLRPLPIAGASRHVELEARQAAGAPTEPGRLRRGFDREEIRRFASTAVLEQTYGSSVVRLNVETPEPVRSYAECVTGGYFDLVRPRLLAGRVFGAEADRPGAAEPVIVLSHPGWRRLTGADPRIVGKALRIDSQLFTVIGVLDASWRGLEPVTPDFWIPAAAYESLAARQDGPGAARPVLNVSGLLAPGVSREQAAAALTGLLRATPSGAAPGTPPETVHLRPRATLLREQEELEPLAAALLAAFALVVVVAAANLTNLQLARAAARGRDLALRLSLGASRSRLVRQLVTESLVVSLLGGAVGFALAALGIGFLQRWVFGVAYAVGLSVAPVELDGGVFLYTLLLAAGCGALCGLLPALDATRPGFAPRLGLSGAGPGGASPRRLRDILIVGQVAASLALLVAAGVLLQSAARAGRVAAGFDIDSLVDLRFDRPTAAFVERIAADPRVAGVSGVLITPLSGQMPRLAAQAGGQSAALHFNAVDDRYFEVAGIPIRRGRAFTAAEAASGPRHVVVSEATARRLWPGADPLGQTVELGTQGVDTFPEAGRYEVIGVAADVMSGWFFEGRDDTMLYLPAAIGGSAREVMVRMRGRAAGAEPRLKQLCRQAGGPGALCEPMTLRQMLVFQRFPFAVGSGIASGLGALALGFACLGLYGLVSFTVVRRTKEIGVRIALGATRAHVVGGFLLEALRRVGLGVALGLPVCLGLSALAASKLAMLQTLDAAVYTVVPLALFAAALAAAFVPARRAAGVDPLVALRQD